MKKLIKKKNNKGFSLVELIVVILIMAVLAVTLAPQVMKWVGNSKISADVSTYETMVSNIQLALTDETVYNAADSATVATTITINNTATAITGDSTTSASDELKAQIIKILGSDYTKIISKSGLTYTITIPAGEAIVERTSPPNASSVK